MKNSVIIAIMASLFLLACTVAGILAYVPESDLQASFRSIFDTFSLSAKITLVTFGIVATLGLVAGLLFAGFWLWEHYQQKSLNTLAARITVKRQSIFFESAPAGHQLYKHDALENLTVPLHLSPGPVNGKRLEPTELDISLWSAHLMAHATTKPAQIAAPVQNSLQITSPDHLPQILPVLAGKDTIMLVGNRGSGKTNILKQLVAIKCQAHGIVLIDPHRPSKICGFDTIGAGGDWAAIESALASIEAMGRFRLKNPGDHQPLFLFVDEWRSVVKNIRGAAEILLTIVHEFRKAQIDVAIASQSRSVKALGIEGEGDLRESFTVIECRGYEGQGHRVFILPDRLKDEHGRKLGPVEYAPPPLYTGQVITPAEVFNLPAPEKIKAQQLKSQGFSTTAIARELFSTDKATGPQIQIVKELLGENAT